MALRRGTNDERVLEMREGGRHSHVPHATSALHSRDVDVEQLILVDIGLQQSNRVDKSAREEWKREEARRRTESQNTTIVKRVTRGARGAYMRPIALRKSMLA